MAVNLPTITPASLKAKNIATEDYVDTNITNSGYVLPDGVAEAINTNTTTIDGAKITTGTVNGNKVIANTMNANTLIANTAWINGEIQSSDYDGTNGFKLKSNAAGSTADPTIYGAYIKGGAVDALDVFLTNVYRRTSYSVPYHSYYAYTSKEVLSHTFDEVVFANGAEWNYAYSPVFNAYAYNSGPIGTGYKHFHDYYVTAEVDLTISGDLRVDSTATRVAITGDDGVDVNWLLELGAYSGTRYGVWNGKLSYLRYTTTVVNDGGLETKTYYWKIYGTVQFAYSPGNSRRLRFKVGSYHYPGGTVLTGTVKLHTG
jgi:hypothetical protein